MEQPSFHEELAALATEQRNKSTREIDRFTTAEILRLINSEDKCVAHAVESEIPYVVKAVELVVQSLREGGRLIYVGAGTSGRLGVMDAAECPPTFGTDPSMVVGLIAGGPPALQRSVEGAEDDDKQAIRDFDRLKPDPKDTVCGIAASKRTPYVIAVIKRAKEIGARTVFVTTNPRTQFTLDVDVAICPEVGPEVIMGSTRMKSATAQKLVLNMMTTASMIRMGKVYENMMVDLQIKNQKLLERARRIIMIATGVDYDSAKKALDEAGGHVKTALVMISANTTVEEARKRLELANGLVKDAIASR